MWGNADSGILGFENRNTDQGVRNPTNHWNRESTLHWQRIQNSVLEIRNPWRWIQIPRLFLIPLHFTMGETAAQWQGMCIWVGMGRVYGGTGGEGVVWRWVRHLVALVLYCTVGLWWEIRPLCRLAILSFWEKLVSNSFRSLRVKKIYIGMLRTWIFHLLDVLTSQL